MVERNDYSPLVNVATGLGTPRDATTHSAVQRPFFQQKHYDLFYRSSWACRRVVETLPRLMCRKWGKFTFASKGDKYLSDYLFQRHTKLKVKKAFKRAQYWANTHGRSYILLVCNDNEDFSHPLDLSGNEIKELVVLDKRKLHPESASNYSVLYPDFYRINNFNNKKLILPESCQSRLLVHKSRLLIFEGNPLPDDERIRENGSEASILESFVNVWIRYFHGSSAMSNVLSNIDVFVHYIDGLFDMLWQGGEEAQRGIQERLETNMLFKSAYKGFAADKTMESIKYESRNLSGVAPISERLESELIAASGLPKSVLFGQFAAGLDASGKITGEQEYLNELVEEGQGDKYDDNLRELNSLLWQERNAPKEPKGWGWMWLPLYGESRKESAQIFELYAKADKVNIESGVYSAVEARTRHEENEFNTEIVLSQGGDARSDDSTPAKKIIEWNGFQIGLQYLPFEKRHGKLLKAAYGHFRKTKGADGMAVDVYVGTAIESDKIFAIEQLIDGNFDEEKMVIGVWNIEQAKSLYLSAMPSKFMGDVREIKVRDLNKYRVDAVERLVIEGEIVSDSEFSQIAEVGEEDIELAVSNWQQVAPSKYEGLLNG